MKTFYFIVLFALTTSPALASNSVPSGYPYTKDGWIYVNQDVAIQQSNSQRDPVRSWIKKSKKDGSYALLEFQVNCTENRIAGLQNLKYSREGLLLSSWSNPHPKTTRIAPGTDGELVRDIMCNEGGK